MDAHANLYLLLDTGSFTLLSAEFLKWNLPIDLDLFLLVNIYISTYCESLNEHLRYGIPT